MKNNKTKIYVAGHNGMVGSSCVRELVKQGYKNLIFENSNDLDLTNQNSVFNYLEKNRPDIIINAAAKVGGILENNNYPYEFLMENMLIQNNLINSAFKLNIKKFIFLGSSCIYPKFSKQPITEDCLLRGELEPTNEWYAIAKISGVKLIQSLRKQYNKQYVSLMPTNLYGPFDNFDLKSSHVLPALIRKFHEAKIENKNYIKIWGSGYPMREFLHVDDLSKAIIFFIENNFDKHIYNVGYGKEISIMDLALLIKDIVGFKGEIKNDTSKPDGTLRKLMDSSRVNMLGWYPKISLRDGIKSTYQWYLKNKKK